MQRTGNREIEQGPRTRARAPAAAWVGSTLLMGALFAVAPAVEAAAQKSPGAPTTESQPKTSEEPAGAAGESPDAATPSRPAPPSPAPPTPRDVARPAQEEVRPGDAVDFPVDI